VFKTNLAVLAQVSPDKKKSEITVGALADPDGVIAEVSEDNNTKYKTMTFGGELCPAGK
jgi:hypothetical protein